jgi:hypothetical protein
MYHLHVPGSLNLLEPSGCVQACAEIVLPFLIQYAAICFNQYMVILRLIKHIKTKIKIANVIYAVRFRFLT